MSLAEEMLWSSEGESALKYLLGRGLSIATIRQARLGDVSGDYRATALMVTQIMARYNDGISVLLVKACGMEQKTVFISYRRAMSRYVARSIYQDLKAHGWDVFLDVNTIDNGDFDRIILNQIEARAHFILLISRGSLERCANAGDWVLREIQEAVRLERNIVPIVEEGADFMREMGYLPADLNATVSKKNAIRLLDDYFEAGMDKLRTRFLKTPEYVRVVEVPAAERAEVQRRMAIIDGTTPPPQPKPVTPPSPLEGEGSGARGILPPPFEWIEIPAGEFTMGDNPPRKVTLPTFWISKYPVTHAQYAKFIDAGGYGQRKWWTNAGWAWREKGSKTEPLYWTDNKWNGAEQPIVGVSWYEVVAFTQWLSEALTPNPSPKGRGEFYVTLPTEAQWEKAARGTDGRVYPWGDTFDPNRCNTWESKIGKTTPVREYEGKGDSPYGVVDMSGNVWEWCLDEYKDPQLDPSKVNMRSDARRVLRGGSFDNFRSDAAASCRFNFNPSLAYYGCGVRLVLSAP